jgi:branched-subunit amino acid transport protein
MQTVDIFWLVAFMTLVTQAPRILPFTALSNATLSPNVNTWLSYVPASIILGMLAPQLCLLEGRLCMDASNLFLIAAIPSLLVSFVTRNIFLTVLTGISALAVLRLVA